MTIDAPKDIIDEDGLMVVVLVGGDGNGLRLMRMIAGGQAV